VYRRLEPNASCVRHRGRDAFALLGFGATLISVVAIAAREPTALSMLPALLLTLPLLLRRYPGERIIRRWQGAARSASRRPRSVRLPRLPIGSAVARGGLLLARSLAVRPPPVPALAVV
jgi:hypothetical protein